tara:strand:+ start:3281 stop:3427 length:147 start_codon:yes stop_codon:yes gene_type:complete
MQKFIIVFLLTIFFNSCQMNEKDPELYKKQDAIENDTLNIERIKIPTH